MRFISFFRRVSILKTLYFNLHYFGLKGLKMPIIFAPGVKFISLKGNVILDFNNPHRGQIKFAKNCTVNINGILCFKGNANIGDASGIYVGSNATLTFGNLFGTTGTMNLNCNKKISFGDGCLVAWEVQFLDTDFHRIIDKTGVINPDKEVIIGHV